MGTAVAMHLARNGNRTVLWASPFDRPVLPSLAGERRHPGLPEHLPESLRVTGPDDLRSACHGMEMAIMGAHSGGARGLVRMVVEGGARLPLVVGVAKGLEPETGLRMSQVYAEEAGHDRVVAMGGPVLAPELAEGLPTGAVLGSAHPDAGEEAASAFRSTGLHVSLTDDLAGLEYCTVAKNVAAIGLGVLDGMGKISGLAYRNAKAALFTRGFQELVELVVSLGGRVETVTGLAGLGDTLVTSLGGRNRLYGELLGEGVDPATALAQLRDRGMTVEGVDSAREVARLARDNGLDLPFFDRVQRILFEGAPAPSVLDCLKEGTSE
jgi:glycerol-3-phosphate dehydrogenase (NAD(P)+)